MDTRRRQEEIQLPDFCHIGNVFLQWCKTLVVTIITLVLAVFVTSIFLTTCGCQLLCGFVMLALRSCRILRISAADDYTSPTLLMRFANVSKLNEDTIENDLLTVFSEIEQHI
ncbi:unnamed protein product [Heligmosomoides polygyrus]|uniref:Envelope glycoprotein n=1 Tax=Heligmosomoides polygyrus TaxID=6339 RepID=A0A183F6S9_HELPZ|nr:unnamed protein product [Heligmosomoides polygyrus]